MNLILMGLPGADKGTQAERIVDTYGIPHISTGDTFHTAMKSETVLGLKTKSYIDKGELVPGEAASGIVKERLAEPDTGRGFLLDGFPHTLDQTKALDTMLRELNKKTDAVISIHVEEDVLVERLAGRLICRMCGAAYHKLFNPPKVKGACGRYDGHKSYQREDDKPETVKNRLTASIESSVLVLVLHKEQGLMYIIDGNREIDTIFSDVKKIIDEN